MIKQKKYCFASMALFISALTACSTQIGKPYERGSTDYESGKAKVKQPDISQTPERSFDGIRVAGYDTDIIPGYWDILLRKAQSERSGTLSVFEVFRSRYKDLEVYQTQAAVPALREFRRWANTRGIGQEFDAFWNN